MTDTTQVNIKVPVSQKREWEQYVEENEEATSLSHLIRLSVQRQISGEHSQSVDLDAEDVSMDVDIDLENLQAQIETMDGKLDRVIETVRSLETEKIADSSEIQEIADKIYDTLPRRSKETEMGELTPRQIAKEKIIFNVKHRLEQGETVKDLAEDEQFFGLIDAYKIHFGVDDYTIQQALDRVKDYSSRVHVVDDIEHPVVFEVK